MAHTRQGVVLTDLQCLVDCQKTSLSLSLALILCTKSPPPGDQPIVAAHIPTCMYVLYADALSLTLSPARSLAHNLTGSVPFSPARTRVGWYNHSSCVALFLIPRIPLSVSHCRLARTFMMASTTSLPESRSACTHTHTDNTNTGSEHAKPIFSKFTFICTHTHTRACV